MYLYSVSHSFLTGCFYLKLKKNGKLSQSKNNCNMQVMLTLSFSDNINRLIYFNIKQNYLTPVETGQKFLVNWRDESLS